MHVDARGGSRRWRSGRRGLGVGLVAGLAEQGVCVAEADLFVGTSAGSVVGSQLALGRAPQELYERQIARAEPGGREQRNIDMSGIIAQFIKLYSSDRLQEELRAEVGAFALQAETMSEDEWIAGFHAMNAIEGETWPTKKFSCTAIDTSDGSFMVWNNESDVPLSLAVASSCAVPGVFPPVTINGRRYMDGGLRSTTNADLARGYGNVLVVAVTASRAGATAPNAGLADARRRRFESEIADVRHSGSAVEVITPDEEFVRAFGFNLMDFRRRQEAAELGLRQGRTVANDLRAFWT
jgi:NTE family protein